MEVVDVPDSKSGEVRPSCRFDSGHRHFLMLSFCIIWSRTSGSYLSEKKPLAFFRRQSGHRHFFMHTFYILWSRTSGSYLSQNHPQEDFVRQSGHRHFFMLIFLFRSRTVTSHIIIQWNMCAAE